MNEKEGDAIRKVQANGEDTDEALNRLFMKGCPRFLTAAPVDYASPPSSDDVQKAYEHQLQLFRNDVKQQCLLSTIRSYLHLYKSMKLSKLASFLNLVRPPCGCVVSSW
jgi:translation initiation factor 3 subunit L